MHDKHTPGPWRRTSDNQRWSATHDGIGQSCYQAIRDERTGKVVALVVAHAGHDEPEPDTRALACMVESTPELLEALKAALATIDDYLEYDHNGDPWVEDARAMGEMDINDYKRDGRLEKARAIIAKATGSTP